ncbi:MAG: FHA domain-containing serine/threonine-protein kinase [Haloarculaceae archaeon]
MTPAAGATVDGRFHLREQVGRGGFATVWLADDQEEDAEVALKVAETGTHERAAVLESFQREIRTLGRFEGAIAPSSVVRYLGGSIEASTSWIALEFLQGDPLADRFRTGSLGESVRRRIALDLAATIDFLHRNDVVYLDIRPENVVVRRDGRPVLLDFNTAATTQGSIDLRFEVDQFKPPELLPAVESRGEPGPHSDVYAWGKLAFYLFTDAKVLPVDVPTEGLDPRSFGGTCSRALADVVQRATRPDPDKRYATGMAVADAVAAATSRRRALLTQASTDVACPVTDGKTMGRLSTDSGIPWVVLPDHGQHVSPRHATVEATPDGWVIEDRSLNGTYVRAGDSWTHLLGEDGRERRRAAGGEEASVPTQSRAAVGPDTRIAPVHPDYGIELRLEPLDEGDGAPT